MRFMTYNILEGGVTHGGRLPTIADLVVRYRPDVLALVECNGFERHGMREMFRLERQLGMRGVLGRASTGFHLAVFVRDLQILEAQAFDDWYHHGALRLKLSHGGAPLVVIATHLCPFSSEARVREAQYLSSHVRDERVVLMGDLNSISRYDVQRVDLAAMTPLRRSRHLLPGTDLVDSRPLDVLESAGLLDLWHRVHPDVHGATLPTPLVDREPRPVLRLDYIFATPRLADAVAGCEVVLEAKAQKASDHYPVVADIDL